MVRRVSFKSSACFSSRRFLGFCLFFFYLSLSVISTTGVPLNGQENQKSEEKIIEDWLSKQHNSERSKKSNPTENVISDDESLAKDVKEPKSSSDTQVKKEAKSLGNNNSNNTTTKRPNTHHPPQGVIQGDTGGSTNGGELGTSAFIVIVAACSVAGLVGLIMAGVCWFKLQKNVKAASDVDYPAYGVTGPTKDRVPSPGDRKLAQSAQMYHYQHQKQQMLAMEKAQVEMKPDASDEDSEEEMEGDDYTVYECPGLAPTGEMEVRNPLYNEETPVASESNEKKETDE